MIERVTGASSGAARLVIALSLGIIFTLTLLPARSETASWNCFFCAEGALADLILNVVLFAPLGAGLAMTRLVRSRIVIIGAATSCGIELAQFFIPGRHASLGDILANTAGVLLGLAIARNWKTVSNPEPKARRILVATSSALAALVLALTGAFLGPWFPSSEYYGQWTPNLGHLEWYRGRILRATVGQVPVPSKRVDDSPSLRASLQAGDSVEIHLILGPRTSRLSSIFRIADQHHREILLVGSDRDDLVIRRSYTASAVRLKSPDLRWRRAMMNREAGDSTTIMVWGSAEETCARIGADQRCGLALTLGDGWTLLQYFPHLRPAGKAALRLIWIGVLFTPLGWWWTRPGTILSGSLPIAALALVPAFSSLAPTPWPQWIAAGAGVALGYWSQRILCRDGR